MNSRIAPVLALLLAACGTAPSSQPAEPPLAGARIGGPFRLTDQTGAVRTQADLAGRWRIMYFGYTYCPDVCPVDMGVLAAGLRAFEKQDAGRGASVVPVFVSVDPDRDTPDALRQFAAAFHPRMIALTGTPAQIADVTRAYGVYYAKQPPAPGGGYIMDHSRQAYLMDPDGRPVALLPTEEGAPAVAAELARWVR